MRQQTQRQHMNQFFSRTHPNSQSSDDTSRSSNANNNNVTLRNNSDDWVVVSETAAVGSDNMPSTPSTSSSHNAGNAVQLGDGQWQCSRCTLINEAHHTRCDACLLPHRHPDSSNNNRVNVTYRQSATNNLTTVNRVLNGAINGAMVGSIFGGLGGLIVGGITGAASGIFIDRISRSSGQQLETNEREMLLNDNGGLQPGTMRVHRGQNFITAASTSRHGTTRVVRLRYGAGNIFPWQQQTGSEANQDQEEIERALLELLLRTSHNRPMMEGSHVIIQPEASFEELLDRFGTGLEHRGASQQVIDSYPVEIVRGGGEGRESGHDIGNNDTLCQEDDAADDEIVKKKPKLDMGTCGICLEDYQAGDEKKSLSCPHAFHKGCIDQWLKRVASCPICKAEVGMYTQPHAK